MAESKDVSDDSDDFLKEELAHVEELLISSREECINIGEKYQNLNNQVQELIKFKEETGDLESRKSDNSEIHTESTHSIEEQLLKYESHIATYQHSQIRQTEIVDELQNRVEEYRKRCVELETALAEQRAREATIEESDSQTQNVFSMDLETALIRLEIEKNRCKGLTKINNLLRGQLETATEVNQTLTSDVRRLTKDWQHARSELLAKESEWKEEEQTFSKYFTKESNVLLSMWQQILNFRNDFANLRNSTERDLSSFKVCICQNIKSIIDAQNTQISQEKDSSLSPEKSSKIDFAAEKAKLQERINDLIDRNERVQCLLEEKEKANSTLLSTIETINSSFKDNIQKELPETKNSKYEKICNEYIYIMKNLYEMLDDSKSEITSSTTYIHKFDSTLLELKWELFTDENFSEFHSIVSSVKNVFQNYSKQIDETNLKLSNLNEQNSMQQRTIEFLEDEREKMQQLNTHLSAQFEDVHKKFQDFMQNGTSHDNLAKDNQSSCVDVVVKSLKNQIESLNAENSHLLTVQEELQSTLKSLNEEKRELILSEQNAKQDASKNLRQIAVLERNMESLRKDYLQTQEYLQQTTLDKELLQQEKMKLSNILSKLEKQCSDLKTCLQQLKDEESAMKESLISLQNMTETLSMERDDLTQYLNDATNEIGKLKEEQSTDKIQFNKEKNDLKAKLDSLQENCLKLENKNEELLKSLHDIETIKSNIEEEKSQINVYNSDLTDQLTKYSTQKKIVESELDKLRGELQHQLECSEKVNLENNSLLRSNTELSMKLETMDGEISELNKIILNLKEENVSLEKALFDTQKSNSATMEVKTDLSRDLDLQKSSVVTLQAQIKELQELHRKYVDATAKEKHSLIMKMQEIEQGFQITLKNEQHQHNIDIDILTQEKESLRERLVSAVDELFNSHQKQQEELINAHQEEVTSLKTRLLSLEEECSEKSIQIQEEKTKVESVYMEQISSLKITIEKLKQQLSENESTISSLDEKVSNFEKEKQSIIKDHLKSEQKLKDELNDIVSEYSQTVKELQSQINHYKYVKESVEENIIQLQTECKEVKEERDQILKESNERNVYIENEKSSKAYLEDRIELLHNQLSNERNLNEVISKSLEDCKQRLKSTQAENIELKAQVDEINQKIETVENSNLKKESSIIELRENLRDVEKSRLDMKREVSTLKKKLSNLESTLRIREQEIEDFTLFRTKCENREDELKEEIVLLKQKLMESNTSTQAFMKETMYFKQKLSVMEHKLEMQKEQYHSALQESLINEQSISEYKIKYEKSMTDLNEEIQKLQSALKFEEVKVHALESRIVKLDGNKRDVENKLYSICLFLRSALGLGSDSGFLSLSACMPMSSPQSQRSTPDKQIDSSKLSSRESPHRLNFSKSISHSQICISDQDIELLKSTLMDMMGKYNSVEKERDDLKDSVNRLQKDDEELRYEHRSCLANIYQLKRDLEDKKNIEEELANKIASLHHHQETIRTLERENRRLIEKAGNVDFNLSTVTREKEALLGKLEDMKKNILKCEKELRSATKAKENAENKATKHNETCQYIETDLSNLKETIASKDREIRTLEHNLQTMNKKLLASDSRSKILQATIEKLNSAVEHHIDHEKLLQQKVTNLSTTLSQNSISQQNFYYEVEKSGKERLKNQKEMSDLQRLLEKARQSIDDYKLKNKILTDEIEDLKKSLNESRASDELKLKNLQSILIEAKDQEKDFAQEVNTLSSQKLALEKRVTELSSSLREYKEELQKKEEICMMLEGEKQLLQKSLEKVEKDKQKSSEDTAKSLLEKTSLGKSLIKMEIENAALQEKVQNLKVQLAELEERHAQRVRDFLNSQSIESKLEDERLRFALKEKEQLMKVREKKHQQIVLGLEEQISVLKNHLEREQLRWKKYHQHSLSANSSINHLHSVLSKSLQNVSDDPQKLLPEAERLDLTTEIELNASPGISVSTPSKLSHTASSYNQQTSTPKAKKQLDLSPNS